MLSISKELCPELKLQVRGGLQQLPLDALRLRYSHETIAIWYGGTPCEKVSKGCLFSKNDDQFVGPHAHPSNLIFVWHKALTHSHKLNPDNRPGSITEITTTPIVEFLKPYELTGFPLQIACHVITGGPTRDRVFTVNPLIAQPAPVKQEDRQDHFALWDGSRWPGQPALGFRRPPTLRAIYPKLLERKVLGEKLSTSELEQLEAFTIRKPDG